MAQFRDATQLGTGTTGAFEIPRPPLTQALDVLVAVHACDIGPIADMTPSDAGWTPLGSWNWANTSDSGGMRLWARTAAATDPDDWQWAQPDGADGALSLIAISETALPALVLTMATATQANSVTAPAQTAATASGLALRIGGAATSNQPVAWNTPTGHTPRSSASSGRFASVSVVTASFVTTALPGVALSHGQTSRNLIGITLSAGDTITSQDKAASDTAGLGESAAVQVTHERTDAAAVTEEAAAGPYASDTAALTEDHGVAATLDVAEQAVTLEEATTGGSGSSTDGSMAADTVHLGVQADRGDAAAVAEVAQIRISTEDTAATADVAHVEETLGPVAAELAALSDASALAAQTGAADSGLIEEAAAVAVARTASDSAALTEEAVAGPRAVEMAALAEQASVLVVLQRGDALAAADEGAAGQPVVASDSAALVEAAIAADLGRDITGTGAPRRTWRASPPRRGWKADLPHSAWSASTPHT